MKLTGKEKHQSKLVNGVTFVLRTVTEPRRQKFREAVADAQLRVGTLVDESTALEAVEPRNTARIEAINAEIEKIYAEEIHPCYIDHFLVGFPGCEVPVDPDNEAEDAPMEPMTKDNFLVVAPTALYTEIVVAIRDRISLGSADVKNFESPTISITPAA